MKNNSKKTNKQNTARSAQDTTRRMSRRTKDERRNILFSKKHVKMETRRALYGTDHGAAYALARGTDLNRRFVAAFLALVFSISTMVIGLNFVTSAEDPAPTPAKADSNLVLEKTISAQPDGTYDLELSAYAKGAVKNTTKQIPTDYVLVVDQSGSMAYNDMPTDYQVAAMPSSDGWRLSDLEGGEDTDGNSADKAYYIQDQEGYHRVYRKWGDIFERVPRNTVYCKDIVDSRNLTWFRDETGTESDFDSQYYYQPASDVNILRLCAGNDYIQPGGENDYNFYPLTISSQGRTFYYSIRLNYKDSTGTKRYLRFTNNNANTTANRDLETGACIWYKNPSGRYFGPGDRYLAIVSYNAGIGIDANDFVIDWIDGNANWDSFYTYGQITSGFQSGMFIQNTMFIRHVGYNALAYRDFDGNEHIIDATDYCNKRGQPTEDANGTQDFFLKDSNGDDIVLYEARGTKETRLDSVKNALTAFVESVANQKDKNIDGTETPVDHRVAIVGFSSSGYSNEELLTGQYLTIGEGGTNGIQKETANYNNDSKNRYYGTALLPANTSQDAQNPQVNEKITRGISALTANGGTYAATGLDMAYEVLTRSDKAAEYANGTRNAVVIFFTDGRPGYNYQSNQYQFANGVVESAHNIKSDVPGVQVYSVGVFGEADGNPLTHYVALSTWYSDSISRNYMEKDLLEADRVEGGAGDWDVSTAPGYVNPRDYYDYKEYAENIYQPDFYKEKGTHQIATVRYRHRDWVWQDYSYKYIPANTHTVSGTFWREALRNTYGYPEQQNDTISDYMTVVSSSYPNATSFDGGWIDMSDTARNQTTYNAVVDSARGSRGPGRYYFTASDADKLTKIFVDIAGQATTSAISSDAELYLQDVISDGFTILEDETQNKPRVDVKTVMGHQEEDGGIIEFPYSPESLPDATVSWDGQTMQVKGFNFAENYIMHKKPALLDENNNVITPENHGKKLVVTIHGLVPKATVTENNQERDNVGTIASNAEGSGIYQAKADADDVLLDEFISPEITRYKYDLNVGEADTGALFDLAYSLEPTDTRPVGEDKAIVFRGTTPADAKRYDQATAGKFATTNFNNPGAVMYVEYITNAGKDATASSADYKLSANVSFNSNNANTSGYNYYLGTVTPVTQNNSTKIDPTNGKSVASDANWNSSKDSTLYVVSEANSRVVTITETVGGSYYSDDDTFAPVLTLIPPSTSAYTDSTKVVTGSKAGIAESFTFNRDSTTGNYNLSIASVGIGDGNKLVFNIPYGWTLKVEQTDSGYYIPTPTITYGDQATPAVPAGTEYPTSGKEILVNTDIVINNVADNITIEGVTDSNNHNWIIYILAAVVGLAAIGAGIFLWKKRNEFVEE